MIVCSIAYQLDSFLHKLITEERGVSDYLPAIILKLWPQGFLQGNGNACSCVVMGASLKAGKDRAVNLFRKLRILV